MPPKKRQRSSSGVQHTYYIQNNLLNHQPSTGSNTQAPAQQHQPQLTTQGQSPPYPLYYPPHNQRYYNYNYGGNQLLPPSSSSHQSYTTPQLQQQDENDIAQGAYLLNNLKDAHDVTHTNNSAVNGSSPVNGNGNYTPTNKSKKTLQRVFIHRVNTNMNDTNEAKFNISDVRGDDDKVNEKEKDAVKKEHEFKPKLKDLGTPNTKHSSTDIIFANGNNREKRRVEMFENYSEIYKFKELNRDTIYKIQRKELTDRLALLSTPSSYNTELSHSEDLEFLEDETDLIEDRDFELTRLKNWRRYRRNKNLKEYYNSTNQLYKVTNEVLIDKLEQLKHFFIKQKNLLNNLDREYTDINSNRAEKLLTGAIKNQPQQQISTAVADPHESDHDHLLASQDAEQTQDSSETDTGFTSANGRRRRAVPNKFGRKGKPKGSTKKQSKTNSLNNTVMSSILEGFAPILTHEEFELITNDETVRGSTKISSLGTSPMDSDPEGIKTDGNASTTNGGNTGRTTTSSRAVREARDREGYGKDNNTATLNKIMKQYISPDNLSNDEVEEDLRFLKSKIQGK